MVEPFDIPLDWRRICCLDYGHTNASALYWAAISPSGQVYVYRELYRSGLTFTQLAEEFSSSTPYNEKVQYLVADPAIWQKSGANDGALSGGEIFEQRFRELNSSRDKQRSIRLEKGNNDRINGWHALREWMRPYQQEGEITAKLQVFTNCYDLIRTVPLQVHDDRNPEDLDTDIEDHGLDSIRYLAMSRPQPSMTTEEKGRSEFNAMIKRKQQGQRGKTVFMKP